MIRVFRIIFSGLLLLLIASCASTVKQIDGGVEETGNYRFDAWRPVNSDELGAINILLNEVDILIEEHELNAAADKLERVLRIKPEYAPAWSRLSWLALQMDSPKRSIQMAKRSNSLAYSDPELQLLNWTFIRTASEGLHDEESIIRANQKIDSLRTF